MPEPGRWDAVSAAAEQHVEIAKWLRTFSDPNLPRVPFKALDGVVGPLPPGFLVAVGGRAKAGKTSFMLGWADGAARAGVPFVFATTEMRAAHTKGAWAAARLGLWRGSNGKPWTQDERRTVLDEMGRLRVQHANTVAFRDMAGEGPTDLVRAVREAGEAGAKLFFYDYFQRLETGSAHKWDSLSRAIRQAKEVAKESGVVLVMAAQLHAGKDRDPVSKFLPPADGDWYGGQSIQQEADIALQLWRPLKRPLGRGALAQFKRGEIEAEDIAAHGTMGVRCSGHRYSDSANDAIRKLAISNGRITDLLADDMAPDDLEARYQL